MYFTVRRVLYKCQVFLVSFRSSISLLIFPLLVPYINEIGELDSNYNYAFLYFSFPPVKFCFMYFEAQLFAYIFKILRSSSSFLYLLTYFAFK